MKLSKANSKLGLAVALIILFLFSSILFYISINNNLLVKAKNNIVARLEQKLGTDIRIDSIEINGVNKIKISNLMINDRQDDNLIKVKNIVIDYSIIDLLWAGLDPLKSIKSIRLTKPEINLVKDDIWNYNFLLAKINNNSAKDKALSIPSFLIYINEGDIGYTDAKFDQRISNIGGKVDLGSEIKVDLRANLKSLLDGDLRLSGVLKEDNYQGEVVVDSLNLFELNKRLEFVDDLIVEGGVSGKIKFKGDFKSVPDYYGDLSLEEGRLSYQDKELKELRAYFGVNNYGLKIKNLFAYYQQVPIKLSGELLGWDNPQLNLDYDISSFEVAKVKEFSELRWPLEAKAKAKGKIRGELRNPSLSGEINLEDAKVGKIDFSKLISQFHYKDQVINLEELKFNCASGQFDGGGTAAFGEKGLDYTFFTSFNNIKTSDLNHLLGKNYSLKGRAKGEAIISGKGGTEDNISFLGDITVEEGSLNNYSFDTLEGDLWLNNNKLALNNFELKRPKSNYYLEGLIDLAGDLNLKLEADNVILEELKNIHNIDNLKSLIGQLDLRGRIGGTFSKPLFSGEFSGRKLSYNRFKVKKMEGRVNFKEQKLKFNGVEIPEVASDLTGEVDLKNKDANFILDTFNASSDNILRVLDLSIPLEGEVDAKTEISYKEKLKLKSKLNLNQGKFFEQKFDQSEVDFSYQDNQFTIEGAQVEYGDSYLTASGNFVDQNLDLKFKAKKIYLKDIDYSVNDLELKGQSRFEGKVYGPISNLKVVGNIDTKELQVEEYNLGEFSTKMVYQGSDLYLSNGEIKEKGNNYQFNGGIDLYQRKFKNLRVTIKEGNFDYINQFLNFDLNLPYQFKGQLNLAGPLLKPKSSLEILLEDKEMGIFEIRGDYSFKEDANLKLLARDFNLEELNRLNIIPYQIAGKLNLIGELSGGLNNLNLDSDIGIEEGKIAGLEYQSLKGRLRVIDGSKLILNQNLKIKEDNILLAQGQVPLDKAQEFDLNLRSEEGNLSSLSGLMPDLKSVNGKGYIDLRLLGSWEKPEIYGEVEVASASLEHPLLDRKISDLSAQIDLSGQKVDFNKIKGNYGEGQFNLEGRVNLDGISPKSYNLRFKGADLAFKHGSWDGLNDVELDITGSALTPLIKGEITAHNTEFSIPFKWPIAEKEEKGVKVNPKFDIKIKPGQGVRVANANINILVQSGSLELKSTEERLELTGKLNSRTGRFLYYNTEFELEEGSAVFEKYSYIPILDIKANTKLDSQEVLEDRGVSKNESDSVEVDLRVYGLANQMNFEFSSVPSLTQEEIINLLTKQGGIGSLLENNYEEAVIGEMWRMVNETVKLEVISKVERSFEESLDLDRVRIKSILSEENPLEIEIGKYISDNLMIKFNRSFGIEEELLAGFEYYFSEGLDNLLINGEYSNNGKYKLGLEATIPF